MEPKSPNLYEYTTDPKRVSSVISEIKSMLQDSRVSDIEKLGQIHSLTIGYHPDNLLSTRIALDSQANAKIDSKTLKELREQIGK